MRTSGPSGAVPAEPLSVQRRRFATPVDPASVARDWAARGFSCEPWVDPPGREWNDFVHDTRERVTLLEGRLSFTVGAETLVLEPGDELVIPRAAVHSVRNIHPRTSRWLFGYER